LTQGTNTRGKSVGLTQIVTVARPGRGGCSAERDCRAQGNFQLAQHGCISSLSFIVRMPDRKGLRFIPSARLACCRGVCGNKSSLSPIYRPEIGESRMGMSMEPGFSEGCEHGGAASTNAAEFNAKEFRLHTDHVRKRKDS
jgi:hypothetical protein